MAPDSFKGTFTAAEVASAIGRGLSEAGRPVDLCPVADGGEGTLDALLTALGGEVHTVEITRADGRKAMSRLKVGDKITAYVTESLLVAVSPA